MKKTMICCAGTSSLVFLCCLVISLLARNELWEILSITFGVTSYHLLMRLAAGAATGMILNNSADHTRRWFRVGPRECELYEHLQVKRWKKHMPTFQPEQFDLRRLGPEGLLGAGCQAEVVHEIIILFSFLPLLLTFRFHTFWVFFITSLLSALVDLSFVILQRYNRPRLIKLSERQRSGKE